MKPEEGRLSATIGLHVSKVADNQNGRRRELLENIYMLKEIISLEI